MSLNDPIMLSTRGDSTCIGFHQRRRGKIPLTMWVFVVQPADAPGSVYDLIDMAFEDMKQADWTHHHQFEFFKTVRGINWIATIDSPGWSGTVEKMDWLKHKARDKSAEQGDRK